MKVYYDYLDENYTVRVVVLGVGTYRYHQPSPTILFTDNYSSTGNLFLISVCLVWSWVRVKITCTMLPIAWYASWGTRLVPSIILTFPVPWLHGPRPAPYGGGWHQVDIGLMKKFRIIKSHPKLNWFNPSATSQKMLTALISFAAQQILGFVKHLLHSGDFCAWRRRRCRQCQRLQRKNFLSNTVVVQTSTISTRFNNACNVK